jgi:hypothetical protein
VKIHSIPIPSAETGGRFIVPDIPGVDGGLLRVNRGEPVEVTPRGGVSDGRAARITINLDGRPLIDFTNENLRAGSIHEYSPAWNMGTA